ncbi:MAG: DUF4918 family protein [Saprospiraceae bacterium]|nr:DUF4918 family protein [Saprospiraceae bacterium]
MNDDTFGGKVLAHHFQLEPAIQLPEGIEWLHPYGIAEVKSAMETFFQKYFSDGNGRIVLLGINPGRHGAGITGLPFTDPIRMESHCGIKNSFKKRAELSSIFVYEVIEALGGAEKFYSSFYFNSICPLGFVKDGKNFNYYDDKELLEAVMPMILQNIKAHLEMDVSSKVAFSIGQGKNFAFLQKINQEHAFFEFVKPLPHPRWVMQYRSKQKTAYVQQYVDELTAALSH